MGKAVIKRLPDSRRGKMIPLGCSMYVVLKVQNENGSRLVIVFFVAFSLLLPYFFSLYSVKIFFKSIHKMI